MDFVPYYRDISVLDGVIPPLIVGAGAVVLAVLCVSPAFFTETKGRIGRAFLQVLARIGLAIAVLTMIFSVGYMIFSLFLFVMPYSDAERSASIGEAIEESYGVSLTAEEIAALQYPQEEPEADFKAYGAVDTLLKVEDGGFEEKRLYLIWEDGAMGLAESSDGQSFATLPPAK